MYKILLSLSLMLTAHFSSFSQSVPAYERFHFSQDVHSYTPLSSSASVLDFLIDADVESFDEVVSDPVEIPFPFTYQNVLITQFRADPLGGLWLNNDYEEGLGSRINGLILEYTSKGDQGNVLYETTGTTGSRIMKIEYQNVSSYLNATGNDTFNFQIWLHEGSNVIEIHSGFTNVSQEYFYQNIVELLTSEEEKNILYSGIFSNEGDVLESDEELIYIHHVTDDPANPGVYGDRLVGISVIGDELDPVAADPLILGAYPAPGTVFRYTPISTTSLEILNPHAVSVFPNPAQNQLNIHLLTSVKEKAQFVIFDVYGRELMTKDIDQAISNIDIQLLPAGQYFLQITQDNKVGVSKFTKL